MSDTFVTVKTFNKSFEAKLAKNLLENEGIESILGGEMASDVLFGSLTVGDQIVLQVREDQVQRAAGVLAAAEAEARLDDDWEEQAESGTGVWTCSICGEPISNRLSVCYSCQTPRESIRAAAPRDRTAIQSDPVTLPTPPPPLRPVTHPQQETDEPAPAFPGDDLARRVLLASLSLFLLPMAWYYLLHLMLIGGELSPRGSRHLWGALLIQGLFVASFLVFVRFYFSHY
jgi:Putative prokaryotic signal transducing protein